MNWVAMWFGILSIYFAYMGTDYENHYAMACVKNCFRNMRVGTKIILGYLIKTMFDNVFIGTGSATMMALLFVRLNDKMHGHWHGMYALANGLNNEYNETSTRTVARGLSASTGTASTITFFLKTIWFTVHKRKLLNLQ